MTPKEFRVKLTETAYIQLDDIRGKQHRKFFVSNLIGEAFSKTLKADIESVKAEAEKPACPVCGDRAMYKGKKQWICRLANCKGTIPIA